MCFSHQTNLVLSLHLLPSVLALLRSASLSGQFSVQAVNLGRDDSQVVKLLAEKKIKCSQAHQVNSGPVIPIARLILFTYIVMIIEKCCDFAFGDLIYIMLTQDKHFSSVNL